MSGPEPVLGITSDQNFGLWVLGAYAFIVLLIRWLYVAIPLQRDARAHIQAARSRVQVERARAGIPDAAGISDAIDSLLSQAEAETHAGRWRVLWWGLTDFLAWSGSRESAAWIRLREADRESVLLLEPETARARLERLLGQLDDLPPGSRGYWVSLREELTGQGTSGQPRNVLTPVETRAYLAELMGDLDEARRLRVSVRANLRSKGIWFVWVGLLLATALVLKGNGLLLLAGAVGGLLSLMLRVARTSRRSFGEPSGTAWVQLFLSPVAGALGAWGGLHLVALLRQLGVLTLDIGGLEPGSLVDPAASVLGLALLFGFSERLLNLFAGRATQVVGGESSSQPPPSPNGDRAARASDRTRRPEAQRGGEGGGSGSERAATAAEGGSGSEDRVAT